MTTLDEGNNGFVNMATLNTHMYMANTEPLYKLVLRLMNTSTAHFADNLETFLWIMWEGTTPDGYSLKSVDWVEIATHWHNEYPNSDWKHIKGWTKP